MNLNEIYDKHTKNEALCQPEWVNLHHRQAFICVLFSAQTFKSIVPDTAEGKAVSLVIVRHAAAPTKEVQVVAAGQAVLRIAPAVAA